MRRRLCLLLVLGLTGPGAAAMGHGSSAGAIIEEVAPASSAERAGAQPGDRILAWSQPAGAGKRRIATPFDLTTVEVEQAPRGPLRLAGTRGGQRRDWSIAPGVWGITARPVLTGELLTLYEEGREKVRAGDRRGGAARWRIAAVRTRAAGDPVCAAWFLWKAAQALADAHLATEAESAFAAATGLLDRAGEAAAAAHVLRNWATQLELRSDWRRSAELFARALALDGGAERLAAARSLQGLGRVFWRQGDLAAAERSYRRALALRERLAPVSLDVATTHSGLGAVAMSRGDLAAQEEHHLRALAIQEQLAPGGAPVSQSLINLSILEKMRGDLPKAEDYIRRALKIQEGLKPEGIDLARCLNNLGLILQARGDLVAAEEFLRRSLVLKNRLVPQSIEVATTLNNLGILAMDRRDLEAAEDYYQQALAVRERLSPGSLDVAATLNNLAIVAEARGDLAAAEQVQRRALAIRQEKAPGSFDVAVSLQNLGEISRERGDLAAAEDQFRQALALFERLSPEGPEIVLTWHGLGRVLRSRGDAVAAGEAFRRALAIQTKLAPKGSYVAARLLHDLGVTERLGGRQEPVAEQLCAALDALEAQEARLGGRDEARLAFGEKYAGYYHDCMEALLRLNRPEKALHVLERSRARLFLDLLAERDLRLTADVPAQLARERQLADTEHERLQRSLAAARAGAVEAEIERLISRLRELGDRREEIAARLRQASPRYAALRDPQPLDLAGVGAALDPGTIFLAYSVGTEESVLFVVSAPLAGEGAPRLAVLPLSAGEQTLREKVGAFRHLIERRDPGSQERLMASGKELYQLLVRPAEALLAGGERLVISPDGPLHSLPFAALVRGEEGFLVAWKPLHVVASATVYAELRRARGRQEPPGVDLVAFGDPHYPAHASEGTTNDPEVRALRRRGWSFDPLPASRSETEAIAALFAPRSRIFVGEQATEERAKAVGPGARYLHFACHAYLDERLPLNSALALTIPEAGAPGDNGLLQAWEILEQVRISADLVTLSACESGLGKELRGEGLVGLTRAFQYAGARSVLASLWAVSDESTSALMTRFYTHLARGATKDEALRQAQLELLRDPATAHPFSWAAFQIFGDWK